MCPVGVPADAARLAAGTVRGGALVAGVLAATALLALAALPTAAAAGTPESNQASSQSIDGCQEAVDRVNEQGGMSRASLATKERLRQCNVGHCLTAVADIPDSEGGPLARSEAKFERWRELGISDLCQAIAALAFTQPQTSRAPGTDDRSGDESPAEAAALEGASERLSPAGDAGSSGATHVWLTASYLLLLAATGGVVVRNRHRITGEALMTADTVSIDDLSRCEIALLNGGAKHAALVATLDLAASEQLPELEELVAGRGSQVDTLTAYLESVAPAILAMPRPSRSLSALDPLSWRVLTACASSSTTGEVRAKVLDSDEMEAMHQRLVALGLLLDADQVGRLRRLWPWLIPPPLIGAACLVAGIVGHQPVNSLSALLFLNLIGLLPALAFLHPRRTRAGAHLLSTTTAPASPIGGVGAAVAAAFDKPTDVATTYPVLATLYQLPDGSEAG